MSRSFLKYWAPVLLWMLVLFSASGDTMSARRSSRIIGPFVRWLFPGISDEALDTVVFVVRKAAHVTVYAVLAVLLWRALRKPERQQWGPWNWRVAGLALGLAALYAITDEFHQAFVPSRSGQVTDVLLDSAGAAFGLFALWLFGRWRKHW